MSSVSAGQTGAAVQYARSRMQVGPDSPEPPPAVSSGGAGGGGSTIGSESSGPPDGVDASGGAGGGVPDPDSPELQPASSSAVMEIAKSARLRMVLVNIDVHG